MGSKTLECLDSHQSGLPSKFNSYLSVNAACIQVKVLFHILFVSLHILALFPALLYTSAFFQGLGLERWLTLFHFWGDMLFACEIKLNSVLSQWCGQLSHFHIWRYNIRIQQWMKYQICYEHIKLLLVTSIGPHGSWCVKSPTCSCTAVCAPPIVASIRIYLVHARCNYCSYKSPSTWSVADDVAVKVPTVAWQVYCPSWDWRSGLMVRV